MTRAFAKVRDQAGLSKDLVMFLTRHEHGRKRVEKLGIKNAQDAMGIKEIKTMEKYLGEGNGEINNNDEELEI